MSRAMASTLEISFDVRGGLLMRQMHHWSAMIFIAAMMIHLLRVYLTGAFRKPREINWIIGCTLLLLGTIEGFTGYSLPDDLLSGTGVRAADGFMKASPVVGSYMSFFLFGGEFPGDQIIPRFYAMHILLIPGILLALITFHLILVVYHKHTQWPGPGKTEAERRRSPADADLHGQGRRLLLHRVRRDRAARRLVHPQPGVEVRSLRPVQGDRGLAAGLVHGLARRPAPDHPGVGDPPVGLHALVEHPAARSW